MYNKIKGMLDASLINYEEFIAYGTGKKSLGQGFLLTMINDAKYYLAVDDSGVFVVCVAGVPSERFFYINDSDSILFQFGFYLGRLFEQNKIYL